MRIRANLFMCFLILFSTRAYSQYSTYKYKKKNHSTEAGYLKASDQSTYFTGGIGINSLTYFGDLTPHEDYLINAIKVTRPGISGFVNYNYTGNIFFRGEFMYGRIIGDDFNSDPNHSSISARKYVRNLSFRNDIVGLSFLGNFNVFNDPFEYYKRRNYNIYFFTGISFFYSNPKTKVPEQSLDGAQFENSGEWVALRPLGTEGQNNSEIGNKYSSIQVGIPFGAGVRIRVGYKLDVYLEASLQYILSDYIDDVGGAYVDLGQFDDELAKALSDRSKEEKAMMKNSIRDQNIIHQSTTDYTYESSYDGKTYSVYEGFGHEGGIRGGDRNDLITTTSIKISYIFAD